MVSNKLGNFWEFCFVHDSNYQKLGELASISKATNEIKRDIQFIYTNAKEEDFLIYKNDEQVTTTDIDKATKFYLDTHMTDSLEEKLFLKFTRNQIQYKQPWKCYGVLSQREIEYDISTEPGYLLFKWAFLGEWSETILALRNMAIDEKWHYGKQDDNNIILSNYLRYTFAKLWKEGKVSIQKDYAAFNTGLVDDKYEWIYAMFVPNHGGQSKSPWKFKGFCVEAENELGKNLIRHFNPLPKPATYIEHLEDMIYFVDFNKDLRTQSPKPDYTHIIIENTKRLPIDFLKKQCYDFPDIISLLEKVSIDKEDEETWKEISESFSNNFTAFNRIKDRLSDSIDLAVKRVAWNYKTAIPMYYPTAEKMTLLLPLSLNTKSKVDIALVVEKTQSGHYLGHTVIGLDWAYNNARLVCKPESDWLKPESIEI